MDTPFVWEILKKIDFGHQKSPNKYAPGTAKERTYLVGLLVWWEKETLNNYLDYNNNQANVFIEMQWL